MRLWLCLPLWGIVGVGCSTPSMYVLATPDTGTMEDSGVVDDAAMMDVVDVVQPDRPTDRPVDRVDVVRDDGEARDVVGDAPCTDTSCTGGMVCMSGRCQCPTGTTPCGDECVNLTESFSNCGACGRMCGTGQVCRQSQCRCDVAEETLCGSTCVSTALDVAHCGGCNMRCPTGPNGMAACARSMCSFTCQGVFLNCDGVVGNGCEVDSRNDHDHCGVCGTSCTDMQECRNGACVNCPSGTPRWCDGQCVNTNNNRMHCGACGTGCGSRNCVAGACL